MIDEKKLIKLSMNVLADGWDDVYVKGINRILESSTATGIVTSRVGATKEKSTITVKLIATTMENIAFKNALKNILGIDRCNEKIIGICGYF